jgi:hypothetical protein
VASLYPKKIGGKTYWYLREMARVDGRPKMVSERYVGSAAEIEALLDAREAAVLPERTRHLAFGGVAAAWGLLDEPGVAGIIDQVAGPRPAGQPLSTGTYLALAALNRLVAPCWRRAELVLPDHAPSRRGEGIEAAVTAPHEHGPGHDTVHHDGAHHCGAGHAYGCRPEAVRVGGFASGRQTIAACRSLPRRRAHSRPRIRNRERHLPVWALRISSRPHCRFTAWSDSEPLTA